VPYLDRLDYVAPMNQEHAFALAVERLLDIEVPKRGQLIRVLFSEIGRILSHLLNITTQALDVGALTPPVWGFEEREKLMVFYERACGARLHAAYFRPGGVHQDLPQDLIEDIGNWIDPFLKVVDDLDGLLTGNRIFKQRNVDIGVVKLEDAWAWGFSGVMVRGSGAKWDLRKAQPYECYDEMDFQIPIGKNGDCYDRYLIRMEEMRQSAHIMRQCVDRLLGAESTGPVSNTSTQGRAAEARRDEALDGSADPSLQALHRGLSRAGRRGLRRRRGAEGRVRRLSGVRRHQQALRVKLRAPGFAHLQAMDFIFAAATCWPTSPPCSAPSISCLVRWTANVRSSSRRRKRPAGRLQVLAAMAAEAEVDRQISQGPRTVRGDPAADAGAGAGRLGHQAAIEHVAEKLDMPKIRVLEVATFYTQFMLAPVGTKAHVQVCGTTPCMLRGAEDLKKVCQSKIHHDPFALNADGTLSWEEVECQGACVNAPMVMIGKDTYEDLTPERLEEIIDAFEAGKGDTIEPGPQIDRIYSAPVGGPITLLDDESKKAARRPLAARATARRR
jgi:NADH-quinone oxidoreductase subunit D